MSSSDLCRPEDVTLLSGPMHSRRLQNQSSAIAHDKSIIAKLQIGEKSYFALAIRDAIHATEGSQRSSRGRFLC